MQIIWIMKPFSLPHSLPSICVLSEHCFTIIIVSKNVQLQLLAKTLPRETACDHPLSQFLKEATAWKGALRSGMWTRQGHFSCFASFIPSPCHGNVFLTKGTEIWKDILRVPEYCIYVDTMQYMYILKDRLSNANLQGDLDERVVMWSVSWCVRSVHGLWYFVAKFSVCSRKPGNRFYPPRLRRYGRLKNATPQRCPPAYPQSLWIGYFTGLCR